MLLEAIRVNHIYLAAMAMLQMVQKILTHTMPMVAAIL